jgi:DNA primase
MNIQQFKKLMMKVAIIYNDSLMNHKTILNKVVSQTGLTQKTISDMEIGYASHANTLVTSACLSDDDKKNLEEVGLIKRTEQGEVFDAFRNRIIFPITMDTARETVIKGFTGRDLSGKSKIKYLHQRTSNFFTRNTCLANNAENLKSYCITEGIKDALKLQQLGVKGAVAILGTSISDYQISMMMGASCIYIMMDNDEAGRSASLRIMKELIRSEYQGTIRIVSINDKNIKDPSDIADKCNCISDLSKATTKASPARWIADLVTADIKNIKGIPEKIGAADFHLSQYQKNGFITKNEKNKIIHEITLAVNEECIYI